MATFAFDLASNDPHVPGIAERLLIQIPGKNFLPRNLNAPCVETTKLCYLLTSHLSIDVYEVWVFICCTPPECLGDQQVNRWTRFRRAKIVEFKTICD